MGAKKNDVCAVCGRTLINSKVRAADSSKRIPMNNGEFMCKICERKIRVMYPVTYKVLKKGYNAAPVDAMRDISLDDYDDLVKKAREYRESLREQYGWYDAVFQIEHVIIKKGLLSKPVINAYGHVLYGNFYFSDNVKLIHEGNVMEGVIAEIRDNIQEGYPEFLASKASRIKGDIKDGKAHWWTAKEGYPSVICIMSRNTNFKPGDIIVKGGK